MIFIFWTFLVSLRQTAGCQATLHVTSDLRQSDMSLGMSFVFDAFRLQYLTPLFVGGMPEGHVNINYTGSIHNFTINQQQISNQSAFYVVRLF